MVNLDTVGDSSRSSVVGMCSTSTDDADGSSNGGRFGVESCCAATGFGNLNSFCCITEARLAGVSRRTALPFVFCCLMELWSSSSPVSQSRGEGLGDRVYLSSRDARWLAEAPVSIDGAEEGAPSKAYFIVTELRFCLIAAGGFSEFEETAPLGSCRSEGLDLQDGVSLESGRNDADFQSWLFGGVETASNFFCRLPSTVVSLEAGAERIGGGVAEGRSITDTGLGRGGSCGGLSPAAADDALG